MYHKSIKATKKGFGFKVNEFSVPTRTVQVPHMHTMSLLYKYQNRMLKSAAPYIPFPFQQVSQLFRKEEGNLTTAPKNAYAI